MRVLIADNQPKVRRALRVLLEEAGRVQIVGEAADTASLLARAASTEPDLVLLDGGLPGLEMVELLPALRQAGPGVCVVVLSIRTEAGPAALAAGADAFVSKADPAEHLLAAIEKCRRQLEGKRGQSGHTAVLARSSRRGNDGGEPT
jgi:two-component system nitrate/nitrite response regulator NarL